MSYKARMGRVAEDHAAQAQQYVRNARDCLGQAARARSTGNVQAAAEWQARGAVEADAALNQQAEAERLRMLANCWHGIGVASGS